MSATVAAAAAAAILGKSNDRNVGTGNYDQSFAPANVISRQQTSPPVALSRYESQKRRDWNTFGQYLRNHRPPLALSRCSGAHVLEFLRYLDQFGKTKVHNETCPFYGHPHPPAPCPCPLRQAWGSLDAQVGRLRAAFEENGGSPEVNPFAARAVRLYLREVRDSQSKARGIAYEKKKRKKPAIASNNGNSNESESSDNKQHHEMSESGKMNHQQVLMVMGRQAMDHGSSPNNYWSRCLVD